MALSAQQLKQLRALANAIKPTLWIGKLGVSPNAVAQASQILDDHELMKGVVQDASPVDAKEAAESLSERLNAQLVQVIGRRFVLFRQSDKQGINSIELVS